jgi:hypothetical protein
MSPAAAAMRQGIVDAGPGKVRDVREKNQHRDSGTVGVRKNLAAARKNSGEAGNTT